MSMVSLCLQTAADCFLTPASPRTWAACRAARTPRDGATPPKPRLLARGNLGRRSCRQQRYLSRKAVVLPVQGGAACWTKMVGHRVAAFGDPHPLHRFTGECGEAFRDGNRNQHASGWAPSGRAKPEPRAGRRVRSDQASKHKPYGGVYVYSNCHGLYLTAKC
jgi:hypothetical protein